MILVVELERSLAKKKEESSGTWKARELRKILASLGIRNEDLDWRS